MPFSTFIYLLSFLVFIQKYVRFIARPPPLEPKQKSVGWPKGGVGLKSRFFGNERRLLIAAP